IISAGTLSIAAQNNLGANPGSLTADQLTINGGTLATTASFSLNDSNRGITLGASNGTIDVAGGTTLTLPNAVAGSGNLTMTNAGTLILSASNSYVATTISGGTLQVGNASTTGTLGSGAVTNNASLVFNRSNALTVSNAIGGTGSLTQAGSGTTTLSVANGYTGKTFINAGTLSIAAQNNLGANPGSFTADQLTINGGTLATTASFSLNDSNRGITLGASNGTIDVAGGTTLTLPNAVAGAGNLTKTNTGTLILSASNSYVATTISGGTLQVGNASTTGTLGSGTVTNNASLVFNRSNALTVSNFITGSGNLTQAGSGTLTLSG